MVFIPPKTRWMYHFDLVKSVIDNSNIVKSACDIVNVDYLTIKEIEIAQNFISITALVKDLILKLEGDQYCTISLCLPHLISLQNKLKKISSSDFIFAKNLFQDISTRLCSILDPYSDEFNIIYVLATYLDNNTNKYLYSPSMSNFLILAEQYLSNLQSEAPKQQVMDFGDLDLGENIVQVEESSELKM